MNRVNSWGKYNFGKCRETIWAELQSYVDTGMAVTDEMLYTARSTTIFKLGGNLAALDGAGYAVINGTKALTFVENHDKASPQPYAGVRLPSAYPGYPLFLMYS